MCQLVITECDAVWSTAKRIEAQVIHDDRKGMTLCWKPITRAFKFRRCDFLCWAEVMFNNTYNLNGWAHKNGGNNNNVLNNNNNSMNERILHSVLFIVVYTQSSRLEKQLSHVNVCTHCMRETDECIRLRLIKLYFVCTKMIICTGLRCKSILDVRNFFPIMPSQRHRCRSSIVADSIRWLMWLRFCHLIL